ncbi:MAG TPA: AsmA-like C-terminal region-containing protein [Oligoflexus sp.]|uniref:AsmA family protein n=1 Tax=Oligoflexus sp. TaxID=1971216 RepID=UPI002D7EAF96|nr:AsmA-like C-terminal region-containing protein [Oligoflexus sp.]HET9241279.1 AsmA-like C-terminal region-containing protein [Oligoflexus sp.]
MKAMKGFFGSIFAVGIGILCLFVLLLFAINTIDWNRHLDIVANLVQRSTDWRVDSLKSFNVHIGRTSSLRVTGLDLQYDVAGGDEAFSAQQASVVLHPLSWFDDRLLIDHISLKNAYLRMTAAEKDATGEDEEQASSFVDNWPLVFIQDADVQLFRIEMQRDSGKEVLALDITGLRIHASGPDSPVRLTSRGAFRELPYQLTGTLGSLAAFQAQAHYFPIQFDLAIAEQKTHVSGVVDLADATFRLDVAAEGDPQAIPRKPATHALSLLRAPPYSFSAQLIRTAAGIQLNQLALRIGLSELEGHLVYQFESRRTSLVGQLHSRLLRYQDFAAFLPTSEPGPSSKVGAKDKHRPWSDFDQLMPLSLLQTYVVHLTVSIDEYRGRRGRTQLRDVQATVTLDHGRLALEPFQLAIGQSGLAGSFIVDSRDRTVQFQVTRQGDAFDFIRAGQAFLPLPRPWPVSYLTARTMKMAVQWPRERDDQALGISFRITDGLLRLRRTPVDTRKPQKKEPGIQIKLAAYPPLILQSVIIQDLRWVYLKKGEDLKGRVAFLRLTSPAVDQPLSLSSEGSIMDLPYQLTAQLGSYLDFRNSRRAYPVEFKLAIAGQDLSVGGGLRLDQESYHLRVKAQGQHARRLQALLPASLGSIPPYKLSFRLAYERGLYNFSDLDVRLGGSHLQGDLALNLETSKPSWVGDIVLAKLRYQDLAGLLNTDTDQTTAEKRQKAGSKETLLSEKHIPLAFMKKFQGDIRVRVAEYYGRTRTARPVQADAHIRLREGRLSISPFNIYASLGNLGGSVTLDAGSTPHRLLVSLGLESLNLTAAARRMALRIPAIHLSSRELVKGKLMGTLQLKSQGSSIAQWASHADGQMQFAIEQGYLASTIVEALSMDLTETLAAILADNPPTTINCMYASFQVNGGVVQTEQFFLSTKDSNVRGEGYVDLRKKYIDYRFEASAKDFSIGSVASPVSFKGPLQNIRISTSRKELLIKTAASFGLGTLINPFLAVVPFIEPGLEKPGQCERYQDRIVLTHQKADERVSSR